VEKTIRAVADCDNWTRLANDTANPRIEDS